MKISGTVSETAQLSRKALVANSFKIILIALIVAFSTHRAQAQYYDNAFGIRVGVASGFSFKHFVSNFDAVEAFGVMHLQAFQLGAMYQRHASAFDIRGMNWYYGGGGFVGFYDGRYHPSWNAPGRHTVLGVKGVLGLEYKIEEIPINVGLDFTPAFDLVPVSYPWIGINVVLRYVF